MDCIFASCRINDVNVALYTVQIDFLSIVHRLIRGILIHSITQVTALYRLIDTYAVSTSVNTRIREKYCSCVNIIQYIVDFIQRLLTLIYYETSEFEEEKCLKISSYSESLKGVYRKNDAASDCIPLDLYTRLLLISIPNLDFVRAASDLEKRTCCSTSISDGILLIFLNNACPYFFFFT